ncbi:MAG: nucleotidyltransferase domain-containing protein, partial [Armatimonadota bacterium]
MIAGEEHEDEVPQWALGEKPPQEQEAVLKEIVRRIVQAYDPDKVILFGSFARGTAARHSDVDLAVIKETDVEPLQRTRAIRWAAIRRGSRRPAFMPIRRGRS